MVALTDSRISAGGVPRGQGQKLFELDDHTICTIASWYDWSVPSKDGDQSPAYLSISKTINFLKFGRSWPKEASLEEKLRLVTQSVGFTMGVIQQISEAGGNPAQHINSEITLGTFENGHYRIASVTITPIKMGVFLETEHESIEVDKKAVYLVRGVRGIAQRGLRNPANVVTDNMKISKYLQALGDDSGSNLTVEGMRQLATYFEVVTARAYPNVVGDAIEMASFLGPSIEVANALEAKRPPPHILISGHLITFQGAHVEGSTTGIKTDASNLLLVTDSIFGHVLSQQLDNILFRSTTFDHILLTYNGAPLSIFDKSNVINNCRLSVTSQQLLDSPLVKQFKKDYPTVEVIAPQSP